MRLIFSLFSVFIMVAAASSCTRDTGEYTMFQSFDSPEGMVRDKWYDFVLPEGFEPDNFGLNKDSINLYLDVRYSEDFNYESLPLSVEMLVSDADSLIVLSPEIVLFNKDGKALGSRHFGLYETSLLMMREVKPDSSFFLTFSSPLHDTRGIKDIGIRFSSN